MENFTSEQVDAITCAWLDCIAARKLPMCGYIDLDGFTWALMDFIYIDLHAFRLIYIDLHDFANIYVDLYKFEWICRDLHARGFTWTQIYL